MAFDLDLDIDLDIIPQQKKEKVFNLDSLTLDIDLDTGDRREEIEGIIDTEVNKFFKGDNNLKSLLRETAAQESHFGKLDSSNIMQLDKPHLEEMKNEKYTPMLGALGVFPDEKTGEFDISNPRTNIMLGIMRYATTPYEDKEAIKTQTGRAQLWKDVYNTEAGKGTPEKYLETLKNFGLGEEVFDPEGGGYDYESARKAGLSPDATGHWPSRDPSTGLILKGKGHKTFEKTILGEKEARHEIEKRDNRYYSFPKEPSLAAKATKGVKDVLFAPLKAFDPLKPSFKVAKPYIPLIGEKYEGAIRSFRKKLFGVESFDEVMQKAPLKAFQLTLTPPVEQLEGLRQQEQAFQRDLVGSIADIYTRPDVWVSIAAQTLPRAVQANKTARVNRALDKIVDERIPAILKEQGVPIEDFAAKLAQKGVTRTEFKSYLAHLKDPKTGRTLLQALQEPSTVPFFGGGPTTKQIADLAKRFNIPQAQIETAIKTGALTGLPGEVVKAIEKLTPPVTPTKPSEIEVPKEEDLFAGVEGIETGLTPQEINKQALAAEIEATGLEPEEAKQIQEIMGNYKKELFGAIKELGGIKPHIAEDKRIPLHLKNSKGQTLDDMVSQLQKQGFIFQDENDLRQTILAEARPTPQSAIDILAKVAKPKKLKKATDWSAVFKGAGREPGKVTFEEAAIALKKFGIPEKDWTTAFKGGGFKGKVTFEEAGRALERIGKTGAEVVLKTENMATEAQEALARMIAKRKGLSENQLRRLVKVFTGRTSLTTPKTPEEAQKWAKKGIVPMSREEAVDLIEALKGVTPGARRTVIPKKQALQIGVKAQPGEVARVRIGVKTTDMGFQDIDTYLEIKNIGKARKITTENMTGDEAKGFINELNELKKLPKGERIPKLFAEEPVIKNKKFKQIHKEIDEFESKSRGAGFDRGGRKIAKGEEWRTPLYQSLEIKGLQAFKDVRLTLGQKEVQSGVPLYNQGYLPLSKASKLHAEEFGTIKAELTKDLKSPLSLKEQANIETYFDHKFRKVTLPKVSPAEQTAINNVERTLLKYKDFVRQYRYHQWLESKFKGDNQGQGITDIRDVSQEILEEGAAIFELQGPEALDAWLKEQNFGTIDIGYVPRAFLRGRARVPYYKIGSFSHKMLKTRDTQVDYSSIPLMARINKYFKNILNLKHMEQPVKKFDELLNAVGRENVPAQTADLLTSWIDALKGQRAMSEPLDAVIRNVFTRQFYRVITLNPFLWWRNLWQRGITPPHKAPIRSPVVAMRTFKPTELRAPFSAGEIAKLKGKLLSPEELEYFERDVGQFDDLMKRYLQFLGEQRTQMPLADKYVEWAENIGKTYAVTDDSNRLSVFTKSLRYYQHYNSLFEKGKISEQGLLNNTPFKLMRTYEQKHFLELMDKDPEEAVRWAAKWNSDNSQWLYQVPERSLSEMKTTMRSFYNLLVWTRGYTQNIGAAAYKATRGRNWGERVAGVGAVVSTILGGYLVEEVNKKVFRRKSFGYNPLQSLLWAPGGPVLGQLANTVNAISYAAFVYSNNEDEFKKKKAIDKVVSLIDRTPEMFLPFYNNVINIFEAITDTAYISPVKQAVTGKGPKEVNRSMYERIVHGIFGGVNEAEEYLNELEDISDFEIDFDMDLDMDFNLDSEGL